MADILKFMHCGNEYNFCSQCQSVLPEEIFGDGSDGNCVIEKDDSTCGNVFIPVGEYNFNNLTICEGVKLRFCGEGVPIIRVKENFINDGCIILRNPLVCCSCTLYEPLLGKTITTTKNDCYDCALTTYNCIYDRVGTPANGKGGAGGAGSYDSYTCSGSGAGGCGGGAGCPGCAGCNGLGCGCNTSLGGEGGAGGTSIYANAGGGGGGGGGQSRCGYCKGRDGGAGQNAPADGIGGKGGNGAPAGSRRCCVDGGPGGGGGYGYRQGGDGGDGGTSPFEFGGNYYYCISKPGGDGGDSYMGKGGNGGKGYYVVNCRGTGGNGGWSYYGDGGQGGIGCDRGNGGWSMFGNGGDTCCNNGSKRGGSSIYGNAGNGSTKGNGMSGGAISWGGSYGLGLFTKNFCLSGQIWGPGFSGTSYSSKSSNVYIVTGREYHCDGCICNKGGSCNGKLYIYNTNY